MEEGTTPISNLETIIGVSVDEEAAVTDEALRSESSDKRGWPTLSYSADWLHGGMQRYQGVPLDKDGIKNRFFEILAASSDVTTDTEFESMRLASAQHNYPTPMELSCTNAECNQFCHPVQHYAAIQCKDMLPSSATECCHLRRSPKSVQNIIHAEGMRCRSRGSLRPWSDCGTGE